MWSNLQIGSEVCMINISSFWNVFDLLRTNTVYNNSLGRHLSWWWLPYWNFQCMSWWLEVQAAQMTWHPLHNCQLKVMLVPLQTEHRYKKIIIHACKYYKSTIKYNQREIFTIIKNWPITINWLPAWNGGWGWGISLMLLFQCHDAAFGYLDPDPDRVKIPPIFLPC